MKKVWLPHGFNYLKFRFERFIAMKRKTVLVYLLAFLLMTAPLFSIAQGATMPAFKMMLTNGKSFSSTQLSSQKPTIIIYFAPDCEHCQILMNEVFKKINDFKTSQIVMVTFEPLKELIAFQRLHQTFKYPNIKVGSELPVFFFKNYYNLQHTPFTALFDKNKKLVVSYKDQTPVTDLIKKLKALH